MPRVEYDYFVYILSSRSRQLYVGVTNSLERRVRQHREHRAGAYTAGYRIDRLVYYEHFQYVNNAIAREKKLKDWNRTKKVALIESVNPTWEDLSLRWGTVARTEADPSAALRDDNQNTETKGKTKDGERGEEVSGG